MQIMGGERYELKKLVYAENGRAMYKGRDLSLNRNVFVYLAQTTGPEDAAHYFHRLSSAATYADERFMHIFDVGTENHTVFTVLKAFEGAPLSQQLHTYRHAKDIISDVLEAGEMMLQPMGSAAARFDITASNLWKTTEGQLLIVNYWEEAKESRQGAAGLATLLCQLFIGDTEIPEELGLLTMKLRSSLPLKGLTVGQTELVILLLQGALQGTSTSSSILIALQGLLDAAAPQADRLISPQPISISDQTSHKIDEQPLNDEDEYDDTVSSKWNVKKMMLISFAGLILFIIAAVAVTSFYQSDAEDENRMTAQHQPAAAEAPVDKQQGSGKQNSGESQADGDDSSIDKEEQEEKEFPVQTGSVVTVPNLSGMTKQEAEKLALASGLKYSYFIESSSDQPSGKVFKQDLQAGMETNRGSKVTFWVSK